MAMDLYRVVGEAGNIGKPGAPILQFELLVRAASGQVSGHAEINQGGLPPPHHAILINDVTGHVSHLGPLPGQQVVTLKGTYLQSFPPPAAHNRLRRISRGPAS